MSAAASNRDSNVNSDWEVYFREGFGRGSFGRTKSFYRQLLVDSSSAIFEVSSLSVEVLRLYIQGDGLNTSEVGLVETLEGIRTFLLTQLQPNEHRIYNIPQLYSWGRLQVTSEAFREMMISLCVFPSFFDILQEFSCRTQDEFPYGPTFRSYISPNSLLSSSTEQVYKHELCYVHKYVEKNGRPQGDPWSLRQTGVYQKLNTNDRSSVLILLQLSKSMRRCLADTIQDEAQGFHPMHFHVVFLLATASNWGAYIRHLDKEIGNLEEKACFSSVGMPSARNDYSVLFSDTQAAQKLRQKLLKVASVLDLCLDTVSGVQKFSENFHTAGDRDVSRKISRALGSYASDISIHQRSMTTMIHKLQGISDLLSKILDFRNNDCHREINRATERNIDALRELTSQIQQENSHMSTLTMQTQRDSKTVKALSTTAMIFLPASLVATIFSSGLVESVGQGGHFVISSQFWIYVLVTFGLTTLTVGCTRVLEVRWMKQLNSGV